MRDIALYEQARPGGLRLLPPARNLPHLQKDFRDMQAMLFGSIPSFGEVMSGLASLERKINSRVNS